MGSVNSTEGEVVGRGMDLQGAWELQRGLGDEMVIVTETGRRICLGRAPESAAGVMAWLAAELDEIQDVSSAQCLEIAMAAKELYLRAMDKLEGPQNLHSARNEVTRGAAIAARLGASD